MARTHISDPRNRVLPLDALPCVWMSAGLIAYKLCDQDFECERCLFDWAMRGTHPDGSEELQSLLRRIGIPTNGNDKGKDEDRPPDPGH